MASKQFKQSSVNWAQLMKHVKTKDSDKLQGFRAKSNALFQR